MTKNKRFEMSKSELSGLYVTVDEHKFYTFSGMEDESDCISVVNALNDLEEKARINGKLASKYLEENEELKQENEYLKQLLDKYEIETNDFDKFMNNREHIRLSINVETNELQRHIYGTGNWFGDFDRVLVKKWLDESTYQEFINRIIEVYNTEFKKR